MNEIKQQLNATLGDTSERARRVQHQVNLKKDQQLTKPKMQWGYYVTVVAFVGLLLLSINMAPSLFTKEGGQLNEPELSVPPTEEDDAVILEKGEYYELLKQYFFQDGSKAEFVGGFENGGVTIQTNWLNDYYVQQLISTDGGDYERIYRINGDQIEAIYEEMIDADTPQVWDLDDLNQLPMLGVILKAPLEVGNSHTNWTLIDISGEATTPFGSFAGVQVIENVREDVRTRKYFAFGFGEVKMETAVLNKESGDYEVVMSMELASLETPGGQ